MFTEKRTTEEMDIETFVSRMYEYMGGVPLEIGGSWLDEGCKLELNRTSKKHEEQILNKLYYENGVLEIVVGQAGEHFLFFRGREEFNALLAFYTGQHNIAKRKVNRLRKMVGNRHMVPFKTRVKLVTFGHSVA